MHCRPYETPGFNIAHEGTSHDIDVKEEDNHLNDVYMRTVQYKMKVWIHLITRNEGSLEK